MAKKGLIYRLTMGKDNLPDFRPDQLPSRRFDLFKDIFRLRFWTLVLLNLITLVFFIPVFVLLFFLFRTESVLGTVVNYSANLGIGYMPAFDNVMWGLWNLRSFHMYIFGLMIPAIIIAAVGLGGTFQVLKLLNWGEGVSTFSNFFKGVKANFVPFAFTGLFFGIMLFLTIINIDTYKILPQNFWSIMGVGITFVIFAVVMLMMLYMFTQGTTYKLKLWGLIKNSFLLSIALLPQNLFFLIISLAPIILCFIFSGFIAIMGSMYIMFGFSFTFLVWTIYAHWVFDKFINDKVEGAVKNRGMYKKPEKTEDKAEGGKKPINARFANPKKKKPIVSVEEGSTFTPLSQSFSRRDLERLQDEKEMVKKEIDSDYDDVDNNDGADK